jgi:Domain of unknown function (DUF4276)
MRKVLVFVEGGQPEQIAPTSTNRAFAGVAESEFPLQSAFNSLFSEVIPATTLIFEMKGGWKAALKTFIEEQHPNFSDNRLLLINFEDRDPGSPKFSNSTEKKTLQLTPLIQKYVDDGEVQAIDHHLTEALANIFFMVRQMEAWIISQPEVLETCFGSKNLNTQASFEAQKKRLIKAPASSTKKPADVLAQLIRYFKVERQGKIRSLEYRKVKHASQLLRQLDIHKLIQDFEDVRELAEKIRQSQNDSL